MLNWFEIGLIALGIEGILVVIIWGLVARLWRQIKIKENTQQEIQNLLERIRIREEDSGNESDGEEEETLAKLLSSLELDNPRIV
ncbi:Vpu [Simian immunodeficiency virus]|uniref:Protein Vpu n=1 Tax=Simian immunodeficiency virus TaxID=11723 RepID=Q9YL64_SIV|nr:Vpu [Simian immunodeficiency virus]